MDFSEHERKRVAFYNGTPGRLTGYDCPDCLNRGNRMELEEDGCVRVRPCRCIAIRKSQERLRRSGLEGVARRCTFESWKAEEPWQKVALDLAQRYAGDPVGWFVMSGHPGAGKTHLCTAVTCRLIQAGLEARYMLWRDVSTQAKALVNDEGAYRALVEPLKEAPVLYIDDFLKGGTPTGGDLKFAFELLNARHIREGTHTILSSELTIDQISALDEGLGSRIYQSSKGNYMNLSKAKNWRLR